MTRAQRRWAPRLCALLAIVLLAIAAVAPANAAASLTVTANQFFPQLGHNVSDLQGTLSTGPAVQVEFLAYFNRTGGVERWGYPTSEAFEENPGVLTQYFQRGVLDYREGPGIQRRLAWDYLGGGLSGSVDLGVEPGLTNPNDGPASGPWGHRISNQAIDGTTTGFLDTWRRLGGETAFGYPKTDARYDNVAPAVLTRPGSNPGFIRQYFQAAVLEYHPGAAPGQQVKLSLLGDTVRDRVYPNSGWQGVSAFASTTAVVSGSPQPTTSPPPTPTTSPTPQAPRTLPTERTVEAVAAFVRTSILRIQTNTGCGSGFFVSADGYVATNWHVVEGASTITMRTDGGEELNGRVVAGDANHDLALIKVDGITSIPIVWGSSSSVGLGAQLVVLGFGVTAVDASLDCARKAVVTTGILSTTTEFDGLEYLQTDASVIPGNSGGPVATLDGRVVGISVAGLTEFQNVNYLIPADRARPILDGWLSQLATGQQPPIPAGQPNGPVTGGASVSVIDDTGSIQASFPTDWEWFTDPVSGASIINAAPNVEAWVSSWAGHRDRHNPPYAGAPASVSPVADVVGIFISLPLIGDPSGDGDWTVAELEVFLGNQEVADNCQFLENLNYDDGLYAGPVKVHECDHGGFHLIYALTSVNDPSLFIWIETVVISEADLGILDEFLSTFFIGGDIPA